MQKIWDLEVIDLFELTKFCDPKNKSIDMSGIIAELWK